MTNLSSTGGLLHVDLSIPHADPHDRARSDSTWRNERRPVLPNAKMGTPTRLRGMPQSPLIRASSLLLTGEVGYVSRVGTIFMSSLPSVYDVRFAGNQ